MREALLQRTLGDLILDASAEAFDRDPAAFGLARGLDARDAGAFARQQDRFLLYRELARNNLLAPLENTFPVLQALLGEAAWTEATAAFLQARALPSPYYRDIAPAFVAWLAETAWGRTRWPAVLELAHYEYLELMVAGWLEQAAVEDLAEQPSAASRLVLDPAARVLTYAYAVHRATVAEPVPVLETSHLLLYRDAGGEFGVLELTEAAAALLVRAQAETLGLDVEEESLRTLLLELQERGALLGFRA